MAKAIRDVYGEELERLGGENPRIIVLEADVGSSTKSAVFGQKYPERYFNVGISELDMVSEAAGMASCGYIPFVNTFSAFLIGRAADPIQGMICYDSLNVKIAGAYSGISDSYDGASHHCLNDLAFMRTLPNMTILSVCDAQETRWAVRAAAEMSGPVYLRLSRAELPEIYDKDETFQVGKNKTICLGKDVSVFATGSMVSEAVKAQKRLYNEGISISVIDVHTLKPIDNEDIIFHASRTGAVVTAEEHSVFGGLGGAICEVLSQNCPTPVETMGLKEYTESGSYEALKEKYGINEFAVYNAVKKVISLKRM